MISLSFKGYASKSKSQGLAAKQYEKRMSQKIVYEEETPDKIFDDLQVQS